MKEGMKKRAQDLRKNATTEENKLWYQYLRTYPVQWNRQKIIGGYIVDFYCHQAKLIIELDGSQHSEEEAAKYDEVRTAYLGGLNLKVIRFTNSDIKQRFREVCEQIDLEVYERMK